MRDESQQDDSEARIRRESHIAVGIGFGLALVVISVLLAYLAVS